MASQSNTTALVPFESYKALQYAGDPDTIADAIVALVDNGVNPVVDFKQIRVPTGGKTTWLIEDMLTGEEEAYKELQGIILHSHVARSFWHRSLDDSQERTPPDCQSLNGVFGIGNPGGDCTTCVMSQMGSKQGGNGSACPPRMWIYLLMADSLIPALLNAPVTSVRALRRFDVQLVGQGYVKQRAIVGFKLQADKGGANPFARIVPRVAGQINQEGWELVAKMSSAVKDMHRQMIDMLRSGGPSAQSSQPPQGMAGGQASYQPSQATAPPNDDFSAFDDELEDALAGEAADEPDSSDIPQ